MPLIQNWMVLLGVLFHIFAWPMRSLVCVEKWLESWLIIACTQIVWLVVFCSRENSAYQIQSLSWSIWKREKRRDCLINVLKPGQNQKGQEISSCTVFLNTTTAVSREKVFKKRCSGKKFWPFLFSALGLNCSIKHYETLLKPTVRTVNDVLSRSTPFQSSRSTPF